MINKAFSRKLMLAAGILAAAVILCSQAFQKETSSFLSKIEKDKSEKSAVPEKKVIVAAQADAVTSSQAVEVGDANPSFIREIILDEDRAKEKPLIDKAIFSNFLRTLFRTFISPQAP